MKKISFLTGVLLMGLAGSSFASDPVITLSNDTVDVTSSDQTIGFTTDPLNANLQLEFIQDPQSSAALLYGWVSSGPQIRVPKGTYPGEWIMNKVYYYTDEGAVVYSRVPYGDESALTGEMAALLINVTNSEPDTVAPEVTAFDIDLDQLTKSEDGAWLYAPCTITATDDNSGFGSFEARFRSGDSVAFVLISIAEQNRIGSSDAYQGYATFGYMRPGDSFNPDEIVFQDNAGNAIVYSENIGGLAVNGYNVDTEPIPGLFDVDIELPPSFDDIPVRIFSSPSSSSSSNAAVESVKKSKKDKKGKDSAKNIKSSKKKDSAKNNKSSKKKGSSAKKSKGSKKSSGN